MTATPETVQSVVNSNKKPLSTKEYHPLESLFYLGYAESSVIEVYKDDNIELKVKFRTITPAEIRDITEAVDNYSSQAAQIVTERIETLARSIISINYMPLVLTKDEQQAFFDEYKRQPSPLEMAQKVLREKIKSMLVIDSMYEKYIEFSNGIMTQFEEAKKKLKD